MPKGSLSPTVGVSFGLPTTGQRYGGYPQNPVGTGGAVNPYYDSPNGLSVGAVDVNPLLSFQATTDDDGNAVAKPLINLHLTPNGCGIFGCEADDYYHNRKQATGGSGGGLLSAAADLLFPKKKKGVAPLTPAYDYYQPEQHQPQYQDNYEYPPGYPYYPPATGPSYQSNRKEAFFPDPTPPHTTPSHRGGGGHGHRTNGNVNFFDGSSLSTKKIKFGDSGDGGVVKHEHHHYHHHNHDLRQRQQQQRGSSSLYYDQTFQRSVDGGQEEEAENGGFVPIVGSSEAVPISEARGEEDKTEGGAFRFPAAGRSLKFDDEVVEEKEEKEDLEGEEDKGIKFVSRRRRSADHGPNSDHVDGHHHHIPGEEDKTSAQPTDVSGQVQPVRRAWTELLS